MRRGHDTTSAILSFWRDVEIFEPQRIPKPSKKDHVVDIVPGRPLPWDEREVAGRGKLEDNERWQYRVYCGVFSLDATFEVLKGLSGADLNVYDARDRGEAALAGFVLDSTGRLIPSTATLSASAWGLGRAQAYGMRPGWADGFRSAGRTFASVFNEVFDQRQRRAGDRAAVLDRLAEILLGLDGSEDVETVLETVKAVIADGAIGPEPGPRRPPALDHGLLEAIRTRLLAITGTTGLLPQSEPPIRIACTVIRLKEGQKEADKVPDFDFLNSFLADDLAHIADAAAHGALGTALRTYLSEGHRPDRIDVLDDLDVVWDATRPDRVPFGRWPAPPAHTLALGQQLAVNNALDPASGPALMGVNGPPGTGKTTLLRDVFAALITERARRLAELPAAGAGLLPPGQDRTYILEGKTRTVPQLAEQLCGFEMVVASSNNGAVENVTLETPAADAIDPRWAGTVDYFSDIATRVLNGRRLDRPAKEWTPAWALLAAALGNSGNRQRFVDAFWFTLKPSKHRKETLPGLVDQLRTARPEATWREARERFQAAERRVAAMTAERQAWYDQWRRMARLGREGEICAGAVRAAQARAMAAGEDLERRAAASEQATAERDRARAESETWDGQRPSLLAALFRGWGTLRAWRKRAALLEKAMYDAIDARDKAETALSEGERAAKDSQQELEQARGLQTAAAKAFLECQSMVDATRGRLGRAFPDPTADREVRELTAPWCDEAFNEARTELFLEALRLHKTFIEHNRTRLAKGLGVAVDIIKRTAPDDLPHATRLAAWQLLFMAVPIVSTTFASVARQFDGLGAEDLGWLLVDESGQATPQAAVGAIWRTKRTLAVGDPLQLEPILALPHTIEQALRKHHDIAAHWLPGSTSVQRLADAQTRFGTTLPGPDGTPLWVGSPLTVHRRCDEPMFTISNRIAYDGLMIADLHGREPLTLPAKPGTAVLPSMWLDVAGGTGHGHWRRGEGVRLDGLLTYLADGGFDMSEVMALTPFVEVARQLERRARTFGLGSTGTVHRAQGKQADIVIFVLGGDPAKPRAAQFAADGPNLVNVAVSRAKRRLYVIGNHQTWSGLDYFADLASELGDPKPWKKHTTPD